MVDPVLETTQLDWLVVSTHECPDQASEEYFVVRHFRVPHEPWGPKQAFVLPVIVRRSRRRVLFCQKSGLAL
jgi:hypothetical protein